MLFKDKLQHAMQKNGMNLTALSDATGIGKSSISQYLSGKNEPNDTRKVMMAKALGLEPDYFFHEITIKRSPIPRLTTKEAAALMGASLTTIQQGLIDKVYPWGYAIRTSTKWTFWINAKRFAKREEVTMQEINDFLGKECN